MTKCPFCGASLPDESAKIKEGPFDNSRDALVYIAQKHGVNALLSVKLKDFFPQYAPLVPVKVKNLVFAVHQHGSAKILKDNLSANASDKEIAFESAIAKLVDAFIAEQAAKTIILEFTEALGWDINQTPPVWSFKGKVKIGNKEWECITFGKYDWLILEKRDGEALLISKDITHVNKPYNESWTDVTWESCTLRQWLNSDFLSEFSSQEQAQICLSTIANENNQWFGIKGGNRTTDRIFLLSLSEVVRYFGDSGQLKNKNPNSKYYIDDQYNNERVAKFNNKQAWWWLRSPGYYSYFAAFVGRDGGVYVGGYNVYDSDGDGGVRPALWLNLKS